MQIEKKPRQKGPLRSNYRNRRQELGIDPTMIKESVEKSPVTNPAWDLLASDIMKASIT